MVAIEVYVCIAAQLCHDARFLFVDAETRFEHRRVFISVIILLKDTDTIVAAEPKPEFAIGDAQAVVRIDLCGVETLLKVLDELVVKSFEEVALEDAVCWLPIPVTMVNVVDVALVVVAHLIPLYVDVLSASERHIGRQSGVVVNC